MRAISGWLGRLILTLIPTLAAWPVSAAFHLFSINEVYSNADGTVQFVELTALSGGQQFVAGHTLRITLGQFGMPIQTFTVPGNLPGDTSGHRFLFGTQGFAALGIVTPDFILPNNFLPLGNGTVNWGEGSDSWTYSGLPSDGRMSLARSGGTAVNSPQNFAGQTGTVDLSTPPPPANYQALWWKSPANSESGWGVNITHQGDILFATWFTYDTDGSGMWLVMSNGNRIGAASYSGPLYRTTGSPFSAPYDGLPTVVQVGTLQFDFTDANTGAMTYTVNGITQSKAITRQIYSSPVADCAAGATPGASPNYQDLWWNSPANSESGWGVNLTHQGDILFATWFTYGSDRRGVWFVMSNGNKAGTGVYTGPLYQTTGPSFASANFNPASVVATAVGSATFTFTDSNNGTFAYTVNGVTQAKPITRQAFSTPATVCR